MKKFFMIFIVFVGIATMGCENVSKKTSVYDQNVVSVTGSGINLTENSSNSVNQSKSSLKKSGEVISSDTFPQIKIKITFYMENYFGSSDTGVFSAYSDPLSPDTRSIDFNSFYCDSWLGEKKEVLWLISARETQTYMDGSIHRLTKPEYWSNNYEVTVYYYVSETEVYSNTKSYNITAEEYLAKFTEAGIGLCTARTTSNPNNPLETWGDFGWYEFTTEQEKNVTLFVSFDITLPEEGETTTTE